MIDYRLSLLVTSHHTQKYLNTTKQRFLHFHNCNVPPKKPQRAAVILTVGGLQSLSLYVKSSYRTTPKLQMSDATENLLSVRDSGAYLSQRTQIQLPNKHKHIISCHSNLYDSFSSVHPSAEHILCLNKSYGFE